MNYYSHHIGDFDRATRHLTRIERSVYRDLLDVYYDSELPLTLDTPALCRKILARSNDEATAVEQVLNEFFTKTPAGWFHDRCEEELDAYRTSTSQKSQAGKASAAKRAERRQQALNGIPTSVEQPCNGTPTNQEPRTKNQEPRKKTTPSATPSALSDLFADIEDKQIVADFKAMRAKQRAAITKTVVDGIRREAEKAGITLQNALMLCCERSWRGFKADWILQPASAARQSGGAWWSTDASIAAKGAELGMRALPGETMVTFKGRIQAAIDGVPAASRELSPVTAQEPVRVKTGMPQGLNLKALVKPAPELLP